MASSFALKKEWFLNKSNWPKNMTLTETTTPGEIPWSTAKVRDYVEVIYLEVSEFELQSQYYVYFQTYTLRFGLVWFGFIAYQPLLDISCQIFFTHIY